MAVKVKPANGEVSHSSHLAFQFASESDPSRREKLHLVRRLDWRFLLPDPNLKRVVYLGEANPGLIAALQHFANYFEVLNSGAPARKPFELAVVRSPLLSEAIQASALLREGGFLYWEITKRNRFAPQNLQRMIHELGRAGFTNMETHWHRPDFERALDIVPVFNQTALDYFFSPGRSDSKKSAAGRFLLRWRLLKYAMTCVSIVATKPMAAHDVTGCE